MCGKDLDVWSKDREEVLESLTVRAGAVQGAEAGAAEEQESDDEGW